MLTFLQGVHAAKARSTAEQMAIPLMERVRLRAQNAKKTSAPSLEGRERDIQQFLREYYHGCGVTSMNIKQVAESMTQSLDFIYSEDQAETTLRLFAKMSKHYELISSHKNNYIRSTFSLFSFLHLMNRMTHFIVYRAQLIDRRLPPQHTCP